MLDDFFIRALFAAIAMAVLAGPLGCFVIWQRLSYFGDTMAHSALLGVACALWLDANITLLVFILSLIIALALYWLQSLEKLASDTILGILAHSSLACGLVALSFMPWVRVDLLSYLFGDILAASRNDVYLLWAVSLSLLLLLYLLWPSLLSLTLSPDIAQAEGHRPSLMRFILMMILALIIALAMRLVGILLITALLIIPPATARRFAYSPHMMAILAPILGSCGAVSGLFSSLYWDISSGPAIVVSLFIIFLLSRLALVICHLLRQAKARLFRKIS